MTAITETAAYEAMLEHHKRLGEELAVRADAVSGAVAAGRPYGAAVAGLIAYLAEQVLPHAAAEERTVYPAAAAHADMTGLVGEMIAEHVTLSALGARLAALTDSAYQDLAPDTGFVLVNDHDPEPLRYQFEAEHAGQFTWLYLESGPEVWRVRIGRVGA